MQSQVYNNVLENNNKKLKIYITVLICTMLFIAGFALKNTAFRHTISVTSQEQEKALKLGDYVSITSDRYFYMGFVDKKKNKTVGYYYLVEAGNAFFVVRSRKNLTEISKSEVRVPFEFKGVVRKDENRKGNINSLLRMKMPQEVINNHFSFFMISDKNQNSKGWMFILLIPLFFFVSGKASGIKNNRKNKERLEKYMSFMSAEQAFDSEFNTQYGYLKLGNLHMTQNWLFSSSSGNIFLMPVSEIIWVFKTITQNKTNGISTGKSYQVNIIFSDGSQTEVNLTEANCDLIVEGFAVRGKDIIIGFTDELHEAWLSNKQRFIEEWKTRRDQI